MRPVRIGNGQGFWGDNVDAPVELLRGGPIDYIGMDYLAEVTLSIMMRQKLKDPRLGYASDFIGFVRRVLPEIKERNVRILTNAGGLNPARLPRPDLPGGDGPGGRRACASASSRATTSSRACAS